VDSKTWTGSRGREQGRIALPQRYPLTVAVDRWPGPLTVDRGGDAGPGVASRQAGAIRGLQRGGLAGRKPVSLHCGSDTTAAIERRIAASSRAATSGQRSTVTVYGRGPGMPLQATEGDTVLLPPRVGGRFSSFRFYLSEGVGGPVDPRSGSAEADLSIQGGRGG